MTARQRPPAPGDSGDDPPADPEQVARTIALRRLEASPRTRAELERTLAERGVPDDVAATVLDRYEEVGVVDDRMYARMWVQSRRSSRGLSGRALRAELRGKGVADDVIDESLSMVTPDLEESTARQLARRRAVGLAGLPRPVAARRLVGYLGRRGYGPGLAAAVVREVLADAGSTDDEEDGSGMPEERIR